MFIRGGRTQTRIKANHPQPQLLPSVQIGWVGRYRHRMTAVVVVVVVVMMMIVLVVSIRNISSSFMGTQQQQMKSSIQKYEKEYYYCPEDLSIGACSRWETDAKHWIFVNTNDDDDDDCTTIPQSQKAVAAAAAAAAGRTNQNPSTNQERIYKLTKGSSSPRGLLGSSGAGGGGGPTTMKDTTTIFSMVFYGSSHMRELHLAMIRLVRGLQYMEELEPNVTNVGSGTKLALNPLWKHCDPGKTGWSDAKYGVDMKSCGVPGKRLVPELGENIAIGFKTFIHTPEADDIFVTWLQQQQDVVHVRHPKVLIADVGVWGPRGTKMSTTLNYTLSLQEEIDEYLTWLRMTFPTTHIVFIVGGSEQPSRVTNAVLVALQLLSDRDPTKQVHLFRKDWIMKHKLPEMECQHGCKGPVLVLMATILLDWLETTFTSSRNNNNLPSPPPVPQKKSNQKCSVRSRN